MTKARRSILLGLIGVTALIAASWLFVPNRLAKFFPGVAATGDELVVSPKTMRFGVEATALLRATSVQNFGAPPEFGNYWQFQIVSLAPEGKTVKSGDQLIGFDAQKIRDDLQKFQNELDQAGKELDKTKVR